MIAAPISTMISSGAGSLSPSMIMQLAVARTPIITCPSPPIFQKRIRNAGPIAREMISRMEMFCIRTQNLLSDPKLPSQMVLKTLTGSSPVSRKVTIAHTMIARTIDSARTVYACRLEMVGRFTIWARGPLFFSFIWPHLLPEMSSSVRLHTCLSCVRPQCRTPCLRTGSGSGPPAPGAHPGPRRHR